MIHIQPSPTLKSFMNDFLGNFSPFMDGLTSSDESITKSMLVDVKESPESYTILADLPGVKKEDISISVKDGVLVIAAERKGNKEDYLHYERYIGKYERTFKIPSVLDTEKIEARYSDGVLEVTIGKKEDLKPKTVKVN